MRAQSKKLIGVLAGIIVVIVGLVIGLMVILNNKNVEISQKMSELRCNMEDYETEIDEEIAKLETDKIKDGIFVYQACIEKMEPEVQAKIYTKRAIWILGEDWNDEYNEQAVADAVVADNILQSMESAMNVMNIANSCGDTELANKYYNIMNERQLMNGVKQDLMMELDNEID